jgi:GAF domain-containing protein
VSVSADVREDIGALRERNARIREQVRRLRDFVDSLQTLVEALDQAREDERIMEALSRSLASALSATDAVVGMLLVLDEDSDELVSVLVHGPRGSEAGAWRRTAADAGFAGWALRHRQPLIANAARSDERFRESLDDEAGVAVESVLAVPVLAQDRALGVCQLVNKRAHGMFGEDDQTLVALMCRFAGELLHRMSR